MQITVSISCFLPLTESHLHVRFLLFQVYLKYPEVALTLPICIGSVALDPTELSLSRTVAPMPAPRITPAPSPSAPESETPNLPPRPAPKPAPKPRPRSTHAFPSAPPADLYPQLPSVSSYNGEMLKSPQQEPGSQGPVSPNAFSYAPGLSFKQRRGSTGPSAPPPCSSSSSQDRNQTPSSASVPPSYGSSAYPQGVTQSLHLNSYSYY